MTVMNKEESPKKGGITLESAEPELKTEYAPVLRVLIAVCYTGILAAVMAGMASVFSVASGAEKGWDKLAAAAAALVVFGAGTVILSIVDRSKRSQYENEQARLDREAKVFRGTVELARKHVRTAQYGSGRYEEITWSFSVSYNDENGDTKTVNSPRYLNDISHILADRAVDVHVREDGVCTFGDFRLAQNEDEGIALDVSESEENDT